MPDGAKLTVQLPEKLGFLLADKARYKVAYGGRGSGKSWGIARALLIKSIQSPIRVLCAREIQRTIADSVHQLLADQIRIMGLESLFTITDGEIRSHIGSQFLFAGLRHQDIHKIKSFEGVDICWVEEAQAVTKKSWEVLIPTIRKPESEIWISFNPELDTDDTYVRFVAHPPKGAIVCKANWSDNPWFPDVLRREMQALRERDPEAARNVWDGECRSAVEGAIYAREITKAHEERRIRPLPIDPLLKVHTLWDLGWNDQTAIILVQRDSTQVRIVDYIEDSHRTLDDYAAQLNGMRLNWGTDYLPHDGTAKNLQTGKTPQEILAKLRPSVHIVPNLDVESGISAARLMFRRCYFDEDRTVRLLECLKRYRRRINVSTGAPEGPLHDEYSNGADAFRYLGVMIDQMRNDTVMPKIKYSTKGVV
jgi:phage terminase large subunit